MHCYLAVVGDLDSDGVAILCSPEPEALASCQRQMLLLEPLSLKPGEACVENNSFSLPARADMIVQLCDSC